MMNKKITFLIIISLFLLALPLASATIEDDFNRADSSSGTFNLGTATNGNTWGHYDETTSSWDIKDNQIKVIPGTIIDIDVASLQITNNPTQVDFQVNISSFTREYLLYYGACCWCYC